MIRENSTNHEEENSREDNRNRMQMRQKCPGEKYGNGKGHKRKAKWINKMEKELKGLEACFKVIIPLE